MDRKAWEFLTERGLEEDFKKYRKSFRLKTDIDGITKNIVVYKKNNNKIIAGYI